MRVGFNTLAFKKSHNSRGIGTYTKNLLENLKKIPDLNIQEFYQENELSNVDLVHYPFFDFFQRSLPIIKKFPTVVTIHDVIPLKFSKHYPSGIRGTINNFFQNLALKNASAIITDSQSSKNDIEKYLKVSSSKIFSIPLAPSSEFQIKPSTNFLSRLKKRYQLPNKFALYVGDVNWNKNIIALAEACKKAEVWLVIIGSSFQSQDNLDHPELASYKKFLEDIKLNSKIKIIGYVPNEELIGFMNLAWVTLLVSFYEGFGLPILESQACGTPVIASNTSSIPEIIKSGGILVNPYNNDEIASVIRKVFNDDKLRNKLSKESLSNSSKYTWEITAKKTYEVYLDIIENI